MTALLVTVAYFLVPGIALGVLTCRGELQSHAGLLARAVLSGVAITGIVAFAAGTLQVRINTALFALIWAAGAVVAVILASRRSREKQIRRLSFPWVPSLLLLVVVIVWAADAALIPLRDWDGRSIWVLKAKAIAYEHSITGRFFQGEGARNLHSEYPLLVPLDAAAVMILTGELDDRVVRWLYLFISVAFLLLLREEIGHRFSAATGAWLAAVVAWLPHFATEMEGGAISAYADLTIAAFTAAAFFDLLILIESGQAPGLTGLWLAALIATKNEGFAIAAVTSVAAFAATRKLAPRQVLKVALPPLIVLVVLAIWRAQVPLEYDENYLALLMQTPARLLALPQTAGLLLLKLIEPSAWSFFWIAAALSIVPALKVGRRSAVFTVTTVGTVLLFYLVPLAITPTNIKDLVQVAGNRLLSHLLGPGATLVAWGWWYVKHRLAGAIRTAAVIESDGNRNRPI